MLVLDNNKICGPKIRVGRSFAAGVFYCTVFFLSFLPSLPSSSDRFPLIRLPVFVIRLVCPCRLLISLLPTQSRAL